MTAKLKKIVLAVAALAALALGGSALAGAASGGKGSGSQELAEAAEGSESGEASEPAVGKESENGAADPDNLQDENGQDDAGEGSEKGESEGSDQPVSAATAARAREAAATETGGTPGSVERDNEKGAAYEAEVTKPDGKKADVRLDEQFKVVGVDEDNE